MGTSELLCAKTDVDKATMPQIDAIEARLAFDMSRLTSSWEKVTNLKDRTWLTMVYINA